MIQIKIIFVPQQSIITEKLLTMRLRDIFNLFKTSSFVRLNQFDLQMLNVFLYIDDVDGFLSRGEAGGGERMARLATATRPASIWVSSRASYARKVIKTESSGEKGLD